MALSPSDGSPTSDALWSNICAMQAEINNLEVNSSRSCYPTSCYPTSYDDDPCGGCLSSALVKAAGYDCGSYDSMCAGVCDSGYFNPAPIVDKYREAARRAVAEMEKQHLCAIAQAKERQERACARARAHADSEARAKALACSASRVAEDRMRAMAEAERNATLATQCAEAQCRVGEKAGWCARQACDEAARQRRIAADAQRKAAEAAAKAVEHQRLSEEARCKAALAKQSAACNRQAAMDHCRTVKEADALAQKQWEIKSKAGFCAQRACLEAARMNDMCKAETFARKDWWCKQPTSPSSSPCDPCFSGMDTHYGYCSDPCAGYGSNQPRGY